MHGQRRDEYKARLKDDATAAKLAKKASQWHFLSSTLIKRRKLDKGDLKNNLDTLELIDKLLCVNPDPIYLWNHRREVLQSLQAPGGRNSESINESSENPHFEPKAFIRQEQVLTQNALQRNPKAYGAWFHRKWSIRQFLILLFSSSSSTATSNDQNEDYSLSKKILEGELLLCAEFLTLDERNFHCWNYRRFIVATLAYLLLTDQSTDENAENNNFQSGNFGFKIDGGWNFFDIDQDYKEDIPNIGPQLALLSFSSHDNDGRNTTDDNGNEKTINTSKQPNSTTNMKQIKTLLENEWDFTTEKISQNFSNGSAFHYRSKLLPMRLYFESSTKLLSLPGTQMKTRSDWVQEELELIRNATFTEPDDQTSWWYFRFILSWANPILTTQHDESCKENHDGKGREQEQIKLPSEEEVEGYKQMLYEEWTSIQELVEAEDGQCKWGLLGLYMISMAFCKLETQGVDGAIEYEGENWLEQARVCLNDLKSLDPDRKLRYERMEQELV